MSTFQCALDLPRTVVTQVGDTLRPAADFFERNSHWFGHALKVFELGPQLAPKDSMSEKNYNRSVNFGVVGSVFTDLPGLINDMQALVQSVAALASKIFSLDTWFAIAVNTRNVVSGTVHSIVSLGLGHLVPLAESIEGAFTMKIGRAHV